MKIFKKILIFSAIFILSSRLNAEVVPASLFTDNMVLQQSSYVPIWGKADVGEKITVKGSWQLLWGKSTITDSNGNWMIKLPTPKAGGPYTINIKSKNKIELNNVMIGEVWLCSGQSNMKWPVYKDKDGEKIINDATKYPNIRLFKIASQASDKPLSTVGGNWEISCPDSVKEFSAVAYHFGKELNSKLNIPIGLIESAWGGTPVEAWTDENAMPKDETLQTLAIDWKIRKRLSWRPGYLYNGMIVPLTPFAIRGAIWYQGEFNARDYAELYKKQFPAMIKNWRTAFQQAEMPFYFVQIAPFKYGPGRPPNAPQLVREGQYLTMKNVPYTGMVVTTDLVEDINDAHPKLKEPVGKRLALWALSKNYGSNTVCSGPIYKSMDIEGNRIRIAFEQVNGGLISKGDYLTSFEIAGADKYFFSAKAVIDSNSVLVSSKEVENPVAVRFGWSKAPQPNLFNKAGLPASPFRTDSWTFE